MLLCKIQCLPHGKYITSIKKFFLLMTFLEAIETMWLKYLVVILNHEASVIKQGSLCLLSSLTKPVVLNVFVTGVLSVHTVQFHLVSQDRDQWKDFVNTVMTFQFP